MVLSMNLYKLRRQQKTFPVVFPYLGIYGVREFTRAIYDKLTQGMSANTTNIIWECLFNSVMQKQPAYLVAFQNEQTVGLNFKGEWIMFLVVQKKGAA